MVRRIALLIAMLIELALVTLTAGAGRAQAAPVATAKQDEVDAYLAKIAAELSEPGLYVDPQVIAEGRLKHGQVKRLAAQVKRKKDAPLRIWVLPLAPLQADPDEGYGDLNLAYRPAALLQQLYSDVDREGTYAILYGGSGDHVGGGFYAYQWARGGTLYDVKAAVRHGIDCCAPDYQGMLQRFIADSDNPKHSRQVAEVIDDPGDDGGPPLMLIGALGVGAVVALSVLRGARGRRTSSSPSEPESLDRADLEALRGPLREEIEQVRQQIGSAETTTSEPTALAHATAARALLDRAHQSMITMASAGDARQVTQALADSRFELATLAAIRDGRPVPERTPPCFVDPRHGPSVATAAYPAAGVGAPVPVCAACQAQLAAGDEPVARTLLQGGVPTSHWLAAGPAWLYLNGYWADQPWLNPALWPHHPQLVDQSTGQFAPFGDLSGHHHPGHHGHSGHGDPPDTGGGGLFGGGHHGGGH
ncbi:MAG: hypothetical protein QM714_18190 [Nocardioides sp.]|uniref:hypothetical protein n=1 Tax=Nocardioides sp. TaxID=35761 RepID=UPI0039E5821E